MKLPKNCGSSEEGLWGEVPGGHHCENLSRIRKDREAESGDEPGQRWAETSGTPRAARAHSLGRGDFHLWAPAQKPGTYNTRALGKTKKVRVAFGQGFMPGR